MNKNHDEMLERQTAALERIADMLDALNKTLSTRPLAIARVEQVVHPSTHAPVVSYAGGTQKL